jgi:hypothetical protein
MSVKTNPYVSTVHAANFSREIANARNLDDLKLAAAKHGDYLIGGDKVRLRDEYAARLVALRGLKP